MAGKEKYVGAPATIASAKTALLSASESRNGVTGLEYPRKPTWSARRQSTVTRTRDRGFIRGCYQELDARFPLYMVATRGRRWFTGSRDLSVAVRSSVVRPDPNGSHRPS